MIGDMASNMKAPANHLTINYKYLPSRLIVNARWSNFFTVLFTFLLAIWSHENVETSSFDASSRFVHGLITYSADSTLLVND